MTRKQFRLTFILCALAMLGGATGLILYALRGNIALFLSPSDIATQAPALHQRLRVGGLVATGSVHRTQDILRFVVTDGAHQIRVDCPSLCLATLPDLFREGQGVVVEGILQSPQDFEAETILAKHDERYMPREVVEALKKQGRWQEGWQEGRK